MIIAISIVGLLFIVWLFAKEYRSIQFKNEVKALFNQSGSVSGKFYNSNETISTLNYFSTYNRLKNRLSTKTTESVDHTEF